MKIVTVTEFRRHFGKYLALASKEIFAVSKYGKIIVYVAPPRYSNKFKEDKTEN